MSTFDTKALRQKLGIGIADLAAQLGLSPDVVAEWETEGISVPLRFVRELRWREQLVDRERALSVHAPECPWISAWRLEAVADTPEARAAHEANAGRHRKSCHYCLSREVYATVWFGEAPSRPVSWWTKTLSVVETPVRGWPSWARPAVWFAAPFGAYSLLRLAISLRGFRGGPRFIATAVEGLVLYVSIGAMIGLGVGGVRELALRRRAQGT